jgi:hypothetical protein
LVVSFKNAAGGIEQQFPFWVQFNCGQYKTPQYIDSWIGPDIFNDVVGIDLHWDTRNLDFAYWC